MKICENCGKRISDAEYKKYCGVCKDTKACEERIKKLWNMLII